MEAFLPQAFTSTLWTADSPVQYYGLLISIYSWCRPPHLSVGLEKVAPDLPRQLAWPYHYSQSKLPHLSYRQALFCAMHAMEGIEMRWRGVNWMPTQNGYDVFVCHHILLRIRGIYSMLEKPFGSCLGISHQLHAKKTTFLCRALLSEVHEKRVGRVEGRDIIRD
jgi:hypothetical protein